jgi:hypothetical protein
MFSIDVTQKVDFADARHRAFWAEEATLAYDICLKKIINLDFSFAQYFRAVVLNLFDLVAH